jgi:hypothetical protein
MVSRYLGDEVPYRFLEVKRKGFFSRLLRG